MIENLNRIHRKKQQQSTIELVRFFGFEDHKLTSERVWTLYLFQSSVQ